MYNQKIADIFDSIADILEFRQDNVFKIRAYRKASRALRSMPEDIASHATAGTLTDIPGIGKELAEKINEIIATGRLKAYEKLKKDLPEGILDVMSLQGVGPRTAKLLYESLKIDSIEKLRKAAESKKLSTLPHIREKTQENILKAISFMQGSSGGMLLPEALSIAQDITGKLMRLKGVQMAIAAGSLRRMKQTVNDIDILAASNSSREVMDLFTNLPQVKKVIARGETKASVIIEGGRQADLRVVEPDSYGAALVYFTGSKEHNVAIRKIGVKKKLKVNEYGVFKVNSPRRIAGKTEEDVYRALGLSYIEPEMREDRGEVEAALAGKLPRIVELKEIRGDLHVHSDYSDGSMSLEEAARALRAMGYEYGAITDHSKSLKIAGGLSEKEVISKTEKIRRINKGYRDFRLLSGTEADIRSDGTIDYPDDILRELDVVIAAVHSGFKQPKEQITKRILKAMDNPHVDAIAHPTGRLIGTRQAYDVDLEAVLKGAKERGVAIEINAYPERLDLDDIHTRMAVDMGVKLIISTDAHLKEQLNFMQLGVAVARRGWAGTKDILNTLSVDDLIKALRR